MRFTENIGFKIVHFYLCMFFKNAQLVSCLFQTQLPFVHSFVYLCYLFIYLFKFLNLCCWFVTCAIHI